MRRAWQALALWALFAHPLASQKVGTAAAARALALHGNLAEAEHVARAGGDTTLVVLAEVDVARGRLNLADSLFAVAIERRLPMARSAAAGRAEIALRRGDRVRAVEFATLATNGYGDASAAWSGEDQVAAGRGFAVLGRWDPQAVHDALRAYDRATAADSGNIGAQIRGAELLLDKYNAPDARAGFTDVLRRAPDDPRALFGMARVIAFAGNADVGPAVQKALAANPGYVPALLFVAQQQLEAEVWDSAVTTARRAIAIDSSSVAGWGIVGAAAWMRGDSNAYHAALDAATATERAPADFYAEVAEAAGRQRRYTDAVSMGRMAVMADSTSARALGVLAENQLRTSAMTDGRANLERAFAIDPYNLWHKNMLDLLDNLRTFRTTKTARFQIVAPADESEILTQVVGPLLETAYDSLASKYNYHPPVPVRVEYYGRHADFSVRTVGLTGLAALGVSFGPLLVLDSPKAQDAGELNLGSTTWHELAHTFTLGLSNNRVPRWMSEGLSVLEERQTGRGWGFDVSPAFLAAYKGHALPVASELNEGLVRPKYPAEIELTYYEASLVMEMIEQEHGNEAVRALLEAYGRGLDTPAALLAVLHLTPPQLDSHFDQWMRARFAAPLAVIDSSDGRHPVRGAYAAWLASADGLVKSGNRDSAAVLLRRAESAFPGDGTEGGPAAMLAGLTRDRNDLTTAAAELHKVTMHSETAWQADAAEAVVRLQIADSTGALAALQRQAWITPYDAVLHLHIAELAEALRDYSVAIRQRRAVVTLQPADPAEARYQVARVLNVSGDKAGARRELLALLEQTPAFERAQLLLLDLQDGHP